MAVNINALQSWLEEVQCEEDGSRGGERKDAKGFGFYILSNQKDPSSISRNEHGRCRIHWVHQVKSVFTYRWRFQSEVAFKALAAKRWKG